MLPRLKEIPIGLVPLIVMFAVVVLQFYQVAYHSLTPWKGGGFGMFSTVDSPSSRILRVYLIKGQEEIPILIPRRFQNKAQVIRMVPSMTKLEDLGRELIAREWVPFHLSPAVKQYQKLVLDKQDHGVADFSQILGGNPANTFFQEDFFSVDTKMLRMLEENEITVDSIEHLKFEQVRLEVWKYKFIPSPPALEAQPIMKLIVGAKMKVLE